MRPPSGSEELISASQTTSNINKWNYVQEINQDKPLAMLSSDSVRWFSEELRPSLIHRFVSQTVKIQPLEQPKVPRTEELPPEAEFEFSNITTMACLLCARQFKSLEQLKRHNNESGLHKVPSFPLMTHSAGIQPQGRKTTRTQT